MMLDEAASRQSKGGGVAVAKTGDGDQKQETK
jgi:hypothetical protein